MKGLRHKCSRDEDCEDFMVCSENATMPHRTIIASISKDTKYANKERLCLCDEARGYMENIVENHCNGKKFRVMFATVF